MRYHRWCRLREIAEFRCWLFHIWCDYELWHWGMKADGIRILGFEFERRY